MSQSGYTPIQLYRTTTAAATPTAGNLAAGELAINLTDEKLYFKNAGGTVKLLASSAGAEGTVTSVAASGGTTGLTFSGSPITSSGTLTLGGTLGVANGGTGTATTFTAGSVVFAGASGVYTQDNANLFWDNSNDRLGIGTATPAQKLDVNGSINAGVASGTTLFMADNSAIRNTATGGNTMYFDSGVGGGSTTGDFSFRSTASYTSRLYINGATGSVGIGTTSPARLFEVVASGTNIPARFGNSQGNLDIGGSDGNTVNIDTRSWAMALQTGGTERMRITTAGLVGIGTSSPSYLLHLNQNGNTQAWISATNAGSNSAGIGFENQGQRNWQIWADRTNDALQFGNNSRATTNMAITSSGNVGIGTTTPSTNLRVVGTSGSAQFGAGTAGNAVFVNAFDSNPIYMTASATNSTGFGLGAASNIPLFFMTNNIERARIDTSGNFGIGTSAPSSNGRLSVSGNIVLGPLTRNQAATQTVGVWSTGDPIDDNRANIGFTTVAGGASSSSYITFATNNYGVSGGERMRIDQSGNVGIGTTSPAGRLDVVSTSAGGASFMRVANGSGVANSYAAISLDPGNNGFNTRDAQIRAINNGSNQISLTFLTSNASTPFEAMRIASDGNVGIGTSAPGQTLQVVNSSNYQFRLGAGSTFNYDIGRSGSDGFLYFYGNQSGFTGYVFSGADGERMRINASGNVGIGTSSPGSNTRLNVAGRGLFTSGGFDPSDGTASGVSISYDTGNNVGTIGAVQTGVSERELRMRGNTLTFFTNGANERMRIDSSGSVVIGATSAAGARFNVTTAGAADVIYVDANTAGAAGTAVYVLPIRTAATFRGGVRWNGTSVEYNTTSDIRLKENITDADDASALIDAIQVRKFDWKETGFHQRYGFVAQELVEVAPEAVSASSDPEEMMGVDYSKLVPMLVKELQSLRARVAQLEGK